MHIGEDITKDWKGGIYLFLINYKLSSNFHKNVFTTQDQNKWPHKIYQSATNT